jgi:acyl-CoA thioesterase YciA
MDRVPAIQVLLLPKDIARPTPPPNHEHGARVGRAVSQGRCHSGDTNALRSHENRSQRVTVTNGYGTIFGGVILSHIDLASAVEARKVRAHRDVTKAMREVEFHEPVFLGDIVNFFTETVRIGRTSTTVRVSVEAERWGAGHGERVQVTEAEVVLVAVNEQGRPVSIHPQPAQA